MKSKNQWCLVVLVLTLASIPVTVSVKAQQAIDLKDITVLEGNVTISTGADGRWTSIIISDSKTSERFPESFSVQSNTPMDEPINFQGAAKVIYARTLLKVIPENGSSYTYYIHDTPETFPDVEVGPLGAALRNKKKGDVGAVAGEIPIKVVGIVKNIGMPEGKNLPFSTRLESINQNNPSLSPMSDPACSNFCDCGGGEGATACSCGTGSGGRSCSVSCSVGYHACCSAFYGCKCCKD